MPILEREAPQTGASQRTLSRPPSHQTSSEPQAMSQSPRMVVLPVPSPATHFVPIRPPSSQTPSVPHQSQSNSSNFFRPPQGTIRFMPIRQNNNQITEYPQHSQYNTTSNLQHTPATATTPTATPLSQPFLNHLDTSLTSHIPSTSQSAHTQAGACWDQIPTWTSNEETQNVVIEHVYTPECQSQQCSYEYNPHTSYPPHQVHNEPFQPRQMATHNQHEGVKRRNVAKQPQAEFSETDEETSDVDEPKGLSKFNCISCKEIPRPRSNQIELVTCSLGHVYCTACASINLAKVCMKCNENIIKWWTPTEAEPLARTLYMDVCNSFRFSCYRNCGMRFRGYYNIRKHDRVCRNGKQTICPFDNEPVNLYAENFEQNHPHLVAVPPFGESEGQFAQWTLTIDWFTVEDILMKKEKHPVYVLYMHDRETFISKKTLFKDSPYTPLAAMLHLEDIKIVRSERKPTIIRCNLYIEWCETEPYNIKGMPQRFRITEVKSKGNTLVTRFGQIKPTFRPFNGSTSRSKFSYFGPSDSTETCVSVDTTNLNTYSQSQQISCGVCGNMNVWHTHLSLVLENGFQTLPTGQKFERLPEPSPM
jgi:hypothetical protein